MFIVAAICFDYAMVEEVFEWRRVVDGQIEFSFVCFLACVETAVDNAIFECGFERVSLFVCIVRHCETRRLAFSNVMKLASVQWVNRYSPPISTATPPPALVNSVLVTSILQLRAKNRFSPIFVIWELLSFNLDSSGDDFSKGQSCFSVSHDHIVHDVVVAFGAEEDTSPLRRGPVVGQDIVQDEIQTISAEDDRIVTCTFGLQGPVCNNFRCVVHIERHARIDLERDIGRNDQAVVYEVRAFGGKMRVLCQDKSVFIQVYILSVCFEADRLFYTVCSENYGIVYQNGWLDALGLTVTSTNTYKLSSACILTSWKWSPLRPSTLMRKPVSSPLANMISLISKGWSLRL